MGGLFGGLLPLDDLNRACLTLSSDTKFTSPYTFELLIKCFSCFWICPPYHGIGRTFVVL